jgi:hypothetical protein
MPDDDAIHDLWGCPTTITTIGPSRELFFAVSDDHELKTIVFPLSELPKIQRRLAEIAAEVKGKD